jgi:RNA polymerase sigma-70 factor, ECF subfamily
MSGVNQHDGQAEPSTISSTLLDQVRAREPAAWQRLVELYGPVVYGWCRQLGVNQSDSADVVQEVFSTVAADIGNFRRDRPGDTFGGWLRTITRHRVTDHFRHVRAQPGADGGTTAYQRLRNVADLPDDSTMTPLTESRSWYSRRFLDVVRAEFEPKTWDAFWRTVVDGQSPAEVAAAMGLSLPAVYQAKSRVLRRLRREMG